MIRRLLFFLSLVLTALTVWAQPPDDKEKNHPLEGLRWRNIGPLNMSGRVTDVEGIPGNPNVVYVGSASGGVWKTVNGGLTFEPIFDDQPIASIGDLALAPSNPSVVYVGTGESNTRNSVSFGNGVYKSTDGGRHWSHTGLARTRHISRVLVHPQNPDVVWVGAVGSIYGPNESRGVFRSGDGGASWEKTLYLDDRHGVSDMDIATGNPNVLFAGLWLFERKPWTHTSGSEQGGLYKSTDGGKTWRKIAKGLPKLMGRIGVKVAPSNPDVVYVIAETKEGVLFRSDDQGESFRMVHERVNIVSRGFYYTDMRVDPADENRLFAVSSRLYRSIDGGQDFQRISRSTHVDYHSLWIDPENPGRMWQGQDGGVAVSYDGGDSWEPVRNLPIAQFYQIYADNRQPFYYLGGGLQDNGTWYGPSRTREPAGILEDDWRMVSFGDAYFVVPHPENPEILISEAQGGAIMRTDMRNRRQVDISPQPRRNDGGPVDGLTYRFNWNAPIVASPHDPMTVYFAGNVVFKSTDFGDTWTVISPDLTTDDPEKQGNAGGPVWQENTTAEYHCTIISFAESPVESGILWAGSDDGNLQLSRDGGGSWQALTVPGVPPFSPVSHVEPSRVAAGTAYVAFDRHMFDDFRAHIFKTEDFGKTWRGLSGDMPADAWVWVVREDPRNPDLIYAGTEIGLYTTVDGGRHWERCHLANLPTVAVHDILVHPERNDLILGTHGRGIWVLDDAAPLQQWAGIDRGKPAHLFPVRPEFRFPRRFTRYGMGDKEYRSPNPPYGVLITYFIREPEPEEAEAGDDKDRKRGRKSKEPATASAAGQEPSGPDAAKAEEKKKPKPKMEILDADGRILKTLEGISDKPGLHRTVWGLDHDEPRPRSESEGGGREFFGPSGGPAVLPGTYTLRFTLGEQVEETQIEVGIDPTVEVEDATLEAVQQKVMALREMVSACNDALRGLDLLSDQLNEREAVLKRLKREKPEPLAEVWGAFEEGLKAHLHRFVREEGKPFWSQGPRLLDLLEELGGSMDDALAAPTPAQLALFDELRAEYDEALKAVNAFFTGEAKAFNEKLSAEAIPPLALPETAPNAPKDKEIVLIN